MSLKKILVYVCVWQIGIAVCMILGKNILTLREGYLGGGTEVYLENPLLWGRANFDGNHYISIAENGYRYGQHTFFPLYPTLIKTVSHYTHVSEVLAGNSISILSFTFGLFLFSKIVSSEYGPEAAKWSTLALLVFPTSFYFSFVYTEGLFFLLCIGSWYAATKNKWLLACLIGALATYTRLVGTVLILGLALKAVAEKKNKKLVLLPLIGLGVVFYMLDLKALTGDALAFLHEQTLFNQGRSDHFITFFQVIWRYIKITMTFNRLDIEYLRIVLEFIVSIIFFVVHLVLFKKVKLEYSFFSFITFLIPTFTGILVSMPRYVLVCFPVFMYIGKYMAISDQRFRKSIVIGSAILQIIFLCLFSQGYWVS